MRDKEKETRHKLKNSILGHESRSMDIKNPHSQARTPRIAKSKDQLLSKETVYQEKFNDLLPRYVAACERFNGKIDLKDEELVALNNRLAESYTHGYTNETLYALGKMGLHNMVNIIQSKDYGDLIRQEERENSRVGRRETKEEMEARGETESIQRHNWRVERMRRENGKEKEERGAGKGGWGKREEFGGREIGRRSSVNTTIFDKEKNRNVRSGVYLQPKLFNGRKNSGDLDKPRNGEMKGLDGEMRSFIRKELSNMLQKRIGTGELILSAKNSGNFIKDIVNEYEPIYDDKKQRKLNNPYSKVSGRFDGIHQIAERLEAPSNHTNYTNNHPASLSTHIHHEAFDRQKRMGTKPSQVSDHVLIQNVSQTHPGRKVSNEVRKGSSSIPDNTIENGTILTSRKTSGTAIGYQRPKINLKLLSDAPSTQMALNSIDSRYLHKKETHRQPINTRNRDPNESFDSEKLLSDNFQLTTARKDTSKGKSPKQPSLVSAQGSKVETRYHEADNQIEERALTDRPEVQRNLSPSLYEARVTSTMDQRSDGRHQRKSSKKISVILRTKTEEIRGAEQRVESKVVKGQAKEEEAVKRGRERQAEEGRRYSRNNILVNEIKLSCSTPKSEIRHQEDSINTHSKRSSEDFFTELKPIKQSVLVGEDSPRDTDRGFRGQEEYSGPAVGSHSMLRIPEESRETDSKYTSQRAAGGQTDSFGTYGNTDTINIRQDNDQMRTAGSHDRKTKDSSNIFGRRSQGVQEAGERKDEGTQTSREMHHKTGQKVELRDAFTQCERSLKRDAEDKVSPEAKKGKSIENNPQWQLPETPPEEDSESKPRMYSGHAGLAPTPAEVSPVRKASNSLSKAEAKVTKTEKDGRKGKDDIQDSSVKLTASFPNKRQSNMALSGLIKHMNPQIESPKKDQTLSRSFSSRSRLVNNRHDSTDMRQRVSRDSRRSNTIYKTNAGQPLPPTVRAVMKSIRDEANDRCITLGLSMSQKFKEFRKSRNNSQTIESPSRDPFSPDF